jgi:hypothetical protein
MAGATIPIRCCIARDRIVAIRRRFAGVDERGHAGTERPSRSGAGQDPARHHRRARESLLRSVLGTFPGADGIPLRPGGTPAVSLIGSRELGLGFRGALTADLTAEPMTSMDKPSRSWK